MANLFSVFNAFSLLSNSDKIAFKSMVEGIFANLTPTANTLANFVGEQKFANQIVCPVCGSVHAVKNGKRPNGTQRYLCKDCGSRFTASNNSITYASKKPIEVWRKFIECMMNGNTLRECEEICGIHRNTAHYWRHKVLDALQDMANKVSVNGIVEADETFFHVSYKGNHNAQSKRNRFDVFDMPRDSHKRGNDVHTRGISHEQVCVPCAVNGNGLSIAKMANLGKPSVNSISAIFDGRVEEHSVFVTDKLSAYQKFAKANRLEHIQILAKQRSKRGYHIQHINSYHSELKRFMERFKGVASKYLNNYLIWHNFVNYAKESFMEKMDILFKYVVGVGIVVPRREYYQRNALPLLVA